MSEADRKSNRAKIAAKIRALRAKTTENGCTEEEAIAAALKMRQLMDEYEIDATEAEMLEDGFDGLDTGTADPESFTIQHEMWSGIAAFTETRCWVYERHRAYAEFQRDMFGGPVHKIEGATYKSLHFFGLKGDVMFAKWLAETLEGFIKRGAVQHIAEIEGTLRKYRRRNKTYTDLGIDGGWAGGFTHDQILHKRISFMAGAAQRINKRLHEEAAKRRREQGYGQGLVVLDKSKLIENEMSRRQIVLGGKLDHQRWRVADADAFGRGIKRGDTATFDRPVNAGAGVQLLT